MNEQFYRGFIKRAQEYGLNNIEAQALLKQSGLFDNGGGLNKAFNYLGLPTNNPTGNSTLAGDAKNLGNNMLSGAKNLFSGFNKQTPGMPSAPTPPKIPGLNAGPTAPPDQGLPVLRGFESGQALRESGLGNQGSLDALNQINSQSKPNVLGQNTPQQDPSALFMKYHGTAFNPNSRMDRFKLQQLTSAQQAGRPLAQAANQPYRG